MKINNCRDMEFYIGYYLYSFIYVSAVRRNKKELHAQKLKE